MTISIPIGYAQCSIEHWLDGYTRPAVTTMGVKILGSETSEGFTVADSFANAFKDAFQVLGDTSVTFRNARAVVRQDAGEPLIQISAMSFKGTSARESTSPALALMISKNTGMGGRRNRGRFYFPWALAEAAVDERGAIAPATITAWQSGASSFLANLSEQGGQDLLSGAQLLHTAEDSTATPITSLIPNPTVRTQTQRQARY